MSWWTGPGARRPWVALSLGESCVVVMVKLKNTHAGNKNDRGTKQFSLSLSSDAHEWSVVLESVLQSVMGLGDCAGEQQYPIEPVGSSRYLKFTALSFYGAAAGLNYISVFKVHQLRMTGCSL